MNCSAFEWLDPQGLGVTYWFETRRTGPAYDIDLEFSGTSPSQDPGGDPVAFTATRTITDVLPGVGIMAYTARFNDIAPGRWHVTAGAHESGPGGPRSVHDVDAEGSTGFFPVVHELAPGVSLSAWSAMVGLGAVAGIVSLLALTNRYGLPHWPTLILAVLASVLRLVGAKVSFNVQSGERATQRPQSRQGSPMAGRTNRH